jgi:hypothetical protein
MITKRDHEIRQRIKRIVPKGKKRAKLFYDEQVLAESGVVVSRAHGRRRSPLREV